MVLKKITTFWDMVLCSTVEIYQRFGGLYCLHLQGEAGKRPACSTFL
jgi:hypothetical protein